MEALIAIIGLAGVLSQAENMKRCEAGIWQGQINTTEAVEYLNEYEGIHSELYEMYQSAAPNLTPQEAHTAIMYTFGNANLLATLGDLDSSNQDCIDALEFYKS